MPERWPDLTGIRNQVHQDLGMLSKQCHDKVKVGIEVRDVEEQIDQLGIEVLGLSNEEFKDIKESLREMEWKGSAGPSNLH